MMTFFNAATNVLRNGLCPNPALASSLIDMLLFALLERQIGGRLIMTPVFKVFQARSAGGRHGGLSPTHTHSSA